MKRVFSLFLILVLGAGLCVSLSLPAAAAADESSGSFAEDPQLYYQIFSGGALSVFAMDGQSHTLPDGAFQGDARITSVEIRNCGVIGKNCFSGCSDLTKVVLGEELTSIGAGSFIDTPKLSDVTFQGGKPAMDAKCLRDTGVTVTYHVPRWSDADRESFSADIGSTISIIWSFDGAAGTYFSEGNLALMGIIAVLLVGGAAIFVMRRKQTK